MSARTTAAQLEQLKRIRELCAELAGDYRLTYEMGYAKGASGDGGRTTTAGDPTGEIATARARQRYRRAAHDADEAIADALGRLRGASAALARPFRTMRDPMIDQAHYPRTVTDGELKISRQMARARRARGEE